MGRSDPSVSVHCFCSREWCKGLRELCRRFLWPPPFPAPPFFFLSPEQSIRDGLLKSLQPSLLFQSFCSRQLFSLLSLRRLPFYVELISFLELCEQSWIYIFPPKCHKGVFFLIIPQDISRLLEKCCKSFIEFFFFLSLVKSSQDGGLVLTGVKLREFHSFIWEVISVNANAKSQIFFNSHFNKGWYFPVKIHKISKQFNVVCL